MNKQDLINHISDTNDLTLPAATRAIDIVLDGITTLTNQKDSVLALRGFGSFSRIVTAPRKGRNPQTGQTIDIPSRSALKFKPSKALQS